jgi:hypothetical protein
MDICYDPVMNKRKVLTVTGLSIWGLLTIGLIAGTAGGNSASHPVPTQTVTIYQDPGPAPTVTATVTASPSANAQGQATEINQDGVYVIGQDIPGGTWHTSGGSDCYYARLSSTNTNDIMDNNNFTGPDTVSLTGIKAFEITGGCTWDKIR